LDSFQTFIVSWMTTTAPPRTELEARANTLLPATLHDDLRTVAERNERTIAAEVRMAIREHVERELQAGRA